MDFGTREILIILGIVLILAILLDGFRRVRNSHNGSIKVSRRKQAIFDDEDIDDLPAELISGKVRVKERGEEEAEEVSENIRQRRENDAGRQTTAYRERQGHENVVPFQPSVPPQSDVAEVTSSFEPPAHIEPVIETEPEVRQQTPQTLDTRPRSIPELAGDASLNENPVSLDEFDVKEEELIQETAAEPFYVSREDEPMLAVRKEEPVAAAEPFHLEPQAQKQKPGNGRRKPFWEKHSDHESPVSDVPKKEEPKKEPPKREAPKPRVSGSQEAIPSQLEVIVLHVMAKKDRSFNGPDLLEAMLNSGLRYGSMHIFHCHQNEDGSGPVHFSLANSIKPGTFDLENMEDFSTPGVTLFMPLEGLDDPLDSYNKLVKTAQNLAKALGGGVKDETRSALTKQTIEHYRQQIIEFTRQSFTLTH